MQNRYPIIGMSPGNSYFKDEVVKELLGKVVQEYGKASVLIADIPAISTYMALGYPQNRARRDKALPQGNNLRNKTLRAMEELGYSPEVVNIVDWEKEVETNDLYQEEYKKILSLYESNPGFKEAADSATSEVLEYSNKEIPDLNGAIKIAVHYLLAEFAFLEFAPKFLNNPNIVYIYHRNWPVYEKYIAGDFDGVPKDYLGFEMVKTG